MAEYSQEQIDKLIADAKVGLFGEEELQKKVDAETDRRVNTGIQKGLETEKAKWKLELETNAKLTAEQLAQKEFEEKLNTVSAKEQEINRKANLIDAKDMLSEASIPKKNYESFLAVLVSNDSETTKQNVQNFIDMFNSTKTELETKIKSELAKIPPPDTGGNKIVTKVDFDKMGYVEKLGFKQKYPELYKEFMK